MKTQTYTYEHFKNFNELRTYIEMLEARHGGAYSYDVVFGKAWVVHAQSPSKIPDYYIAPSRNQLYYKGEWREFSEAARIREQNRGMGRE